MKIVEIKENGESCELIIDFTPEELELLEGEAKRVNKTVEEVFIDLLQDLVLNDTLKDLK